MNDHTDKGDYKTLLVSILRQAIDDYIKLLHPRYRRKKYLQEAWQDAIDMFFDSEYRMMHVKNEFGEDMSIKDLVSTLLESDQNDIKRLQNHVIDEALVFWKAKQVSTIDIPDTVVVDGHVYYIHHTTEDGYVIKPETKTVTLNKDSSNSENEQNFVNALMELAVRHSGADISTEDRGKLSDTWFRVLRLNNCFVGDT
jgi:hypothetical protein